MGDIGNIHTVIEVPTVESIVPEHTEARPHPAPVTPVPADAT